MWLAAAGWTTFSDMGGPAHDVDDDLAALEGRHVVSDLARYVSYRVSRRIGAGGMAVAFFALRNGPDGQCPVVLKIIRPDFVRSFGATSALTVQKEAVALGRLNERVPPTPFVVRLIDTGRQRVRHGSEESDLPWIALEFVHGGALGTTLDQRVEHSIRVTGHAFGPARAARAVRCLVSGLEAVHEAGVIHRDVKPSNVLCSGTGPEELFRLADFGVSRPTGMAATFGGILVGTPGYAAPEQAALDLRRIGPWTDVFGLATVIFFLLTGENYFQLDSPGNALLAVRDAQRKSVLGAEALAPELRKRAGACARIDEILGRATAARASDRPQSAAEFGGLLLPHLDLEEVVARSQRAGR